MPPPASRLASPSSPSSLSRPTPTTATASERRVKAPSRPREWPRGTFLFALWPRRQDLPTPNTVIISDLRDMDVHQHLSCTASDVPSGLTRDTRAKSKNVTALAHYAAQRKARLHAWQPTHFSLLLQPPDETAPPPPPTWRRVTIWLYPVQYDTPFPATNAVTIASSLSTPHNTPQATLSKKLLYPSCKPLQNLLVRRPSI